MTEDHTNCEDLGFSVLEVEVAIILLVEVAQHQLVYLLHYETGICELSHTILIEEKQHEHTGRLWEIELHLN